ncbi:hypothetical protein [Heliothis virescens ascovirus 3j]|uniref:Uncharacterized protein n=1 Tax=Heliothis virescens ascovirus 3j TaxID=1561067 RepID=A0A2Z5UZA1_9VIRU|nr:hypothetical protein [Heliothis virescens ascovirus 3j]
MGRQIKVYNFDMTSFIPQKVYKTSGTKLQKYTDMVLVLHNLNYVPDYIAEFCRQIVDPNATMKTFTRSGATYAINNSYTIDALRLYALKHWSTANSKRPLREFLNKANSIIDNIERTSEIVDVVDATRKISCLA